jgi:hypothetical protein
VRFRNLTITVVLYAVAMAYLESAVVVYLQRAVALTPGRLFPISGPDVVGNFAGIEVGREFATLVMLVAIGGLAGRHWTDRLAWTAVAFGVWDIFYYVWLWVFIGWPGSPNTWDLLFLIPVPWAGPVWAPCLVSLALVGAGLAAAAASRAGHPPRVGPLQAAGAVAGGLLVVVSFVANDPALLDGGLPGWYPWPIFAAGMGLALWASAVALRAGRTAGRTSAEASSGRTGRLRSGAA